jgi:uncharacterized membrane-anchored protein YitT (DUF2179 family)
VLKDYGVTHLVKTIYGTGVFSVALDLTAKMEGVVNDIFLGSVFGGITLGLGSGSSFCSTGTPAGRTCLLF